MSGGGVVSADHSGLCVTRVFFFNDTATTEIYTLSLHDALPIWQFRPPYVPTSDQSRSKIMRSPPERRRFPRSKVPGRGDRKSTRLNSSHANISYAVFCLKKKTSLAWHVFRFLFRSFFPTSSSCS